MSNLIRDMHFVRIKMLIKESKRAQKLYFMHYLSVVIILFTKNLYMPPFFTYTFEKLVFRLSVFCLF